jgi:hypothetical protein
MRLIDNRAQVAKAARQLHQPDLTRRKAADEILAISAAARDPRTADLYAARFPNSRAAKGAMAYDDGRGVRICNVVLISAAPRGAADRRRFDRLVSVLKERC